MKTIDYTTYKKPSDYINFPQGNTSIRIISKGYLGMQHGLRSARGWVNLGLCTEDNTCEHCKNGNEAKRFWKWVVVDRSTNEVKLLDAGVMLGNQICEIAKVNGDPKKYDIVVTRTGEKLKTKYAAAKAGADKPITNDDVSKWQGGKHFIVNKYLKGQNE